MLDSVELIEEGVGFGVPIAKYEDKTFFASSAHLSISETDSTVELAKTYLLDTISRKKLPNGKYFDDGFYTLARKTFQKYYLSKKCLTPLFNKMMELREAAKIKTEFVKVKPRGTVIVKYQLQPKGVDIKVDFSDLTLSGCEEVLVLNEQGSNTFKKYADANGLALFGAGIGAWDAVSANEASMLSETAQVGFRLKKHREALLYRGWERTKNRFSWAGLSYSLKPNNRTFEYQIELL